MSVQLRVTGTWAELTADGTVAIPATPQAGDRMYLFARWKDFSVTATVANWTELVEFADGSVSSGNGTGSVKVGCWYRDWQPGDSDPTLDFSANPTNASAVITVMQKGADDVWLAPVARTAAMTTWTTTSQSVSASATVDVPGSGVVMGLIGIRDDTGAMTRPTNGIDDAGGLVTWNGNYVESPATHHSTTTGDDGAADLGYRLVTTGASGATLRLTGTISAAETGAALWVVQGVSVLVTPANATLTTSQFAPQLKLAVTPASTSLTTSAFAPQLQETITPAAASLNVAGFVPTLTLRVTPPAATLAITSFAPRLQEILTPASLSLGITGFAPTLGLSVTPAGALLALSAFSPTITQNILITVPNATLTLTTSSPRILPFRLVYLDPGGDAVQEVGYFHSIVSDGSRVSFDNTQQAVGVGSYRFDSGASLAPTVAVNGILGTARRGSFYWRYDSIPDKVDTDVKSLISPSVYSGGGFAGFLGAPVSSEMEDDDGQYGTATPAKNSGQGNRFSLISPAAAVGAVILSVKIIYERKYDTDTSIGISRVKWVLNGEEGPNHDNTDMPLTDTVVEVDVTGDRAWEWQDFNNLGNTFEVIAEARRGDTDTSHTQSWDYVKVEVEYHSPAWIVEILNSTDQMMSRIALSPRETGVVLRFTDGAGDSYDGITLLLPDTWYRISFAYFYHDLNDLDINIFVGGIPELSIAGAHTDDKSLPANLQYGWIVTPGVDHLAWFDQLFIDDGDDLQDPQRPRTTAKLPAMVNENDWNTTIGTGAVDERPLSESNGKQHTSVTGVRQTYTLQTAATGDVDISGETLLGHMGWAWTKRGSGSVEFIALVLNGVEYQKLLDTTPTLVRQIVTDAVYPSDAAGIGMLSNNDSADTFLYECGVIIAYEGPQENVPLLEFQLLEEDSITPASDNVSGEDPARYAIRSEVAASPDAVVTTTIYASGSEGETPQQHAVIESHGGEETGRVIIAPGEELSVSVEVVGADAEVGLVRTLNID